MFVDDVCKYLLKISSVFLIILFPFCKKHSPYKPKNFQSFFVETKDGVKIHLEFFDSPGTHQVVLCPGINTRGSFWYSYADENGNNFVTLLLDEGFDVWTVDLRGVGKSEKPHPFEFADYFWDVSAVIDFVNERTGVKPFWIGHSMGTMVFYLAVSFWPKIQDNVAGVVVISSPARVWSPLEIWSELEKIKKDIFAFFDSVPYLPTKTPLDILASLPFFGKVEIFKKLEDIVWNTSVVSEKIRRDVMRWGTDVISSPVAKLFLKVAFGDDDFGFKFEDLRAPVLFVVGVLDWLATPPTVLEAYFKTASQRKFFILAGKGEGFSADFGHVDIITSDIAHREVLPKIVEFLRKGEVSESFEPTTAISVPLHGGGGEVKIEKGSGRISVLVLQDIFTSSDVLHNLIERMQKFAKEIFYIDKIEGIEDIKVGLEKLCKSDSVLKGVLAWGTSALVVLHSIYEQNCADFIVFVSPAFFSQMNFASISQLYKESLEKKDRKNGVETITLKTFLRNLPKIPYVYLVATAGSEKIYWWGVYSLVKPMGADGVELVARADLEDNVKFSDTYFNDRVFDAIEKFLKDVERRALF